jgi:DAHL domain
LQNSLTYFGLFSNRLYASDRSGPLAPLVGTLAAAMLHLTLDTSPAAAREVEERLNGLATDPSPSGDSDTTQALLAHAHMLQKLLPATDATLKALFALPIKQKQTAVRALLLERQLASRTAARNFRLLLYAASLALVGILIRLGFQLRARAQALQRRAAFEHVIAGISTRFINSKPQELPSHVETALAELAEFLGADRAYLVVVGPPCEIFKWRREGINYPAGWPERASALVTAFSSATEGIVHIPRVDWLPAGAFRNVLAAFGVRSWVCVSNLIDSDRADTGAVLGFDLVCVRSFAKTSELRLLPMALDAIASAIGRQSLEQDRTRLERRLQQARRMETVGDQRHRPQLQQHCRRHPWACGNGGGPRRHKKAITQHHRNPTCGGAGA